MARRSTLVLVVLAFTIFLSFRTSPFAQQQQSGTSASVPRVVLFNGTLKDRNGRPLSGVVGITFSFYKDQQGGAAVWTENQNLQFDEQGRYVALLGATQAEGLPVELFTSGEPRWVGVQVQLPEEQEQPRVLMVSVPYALHAADADTIGGKPASAFVLADSGNQPVSQSGATPGIADRSGVAPRFAASGTGTSTANRTVKWTDANGTLADGSIQDNGPGVSMAIDPSGNVGIGTTAPLDLLTVGAGGTGSNDAALRIDSGSGGGRPLMRYTRNGTAYALMGIANGTNSLTPGSVDGDFVYRAQGQKILYTTDSGSTTALTIAANGNVGIGATNPAAKLDVAGNLKVSGNILGTLGLAAGGALQINGTSFLHNFGTDNTFVGANAGNMSMTGTDNTAGGFQSLSNNTTGTFNTANGSQTLYHNTTGSGNTANGYSALLNNTTGVGNTATGNIALDSNTTGFANTANGSRALPSNTTGSGNTANGYNALLNNTTADNNTASGYNALTANTTGGSNTAFGVSALFSSTTASGNVAMGFNAMYSNTSGSGNTAVGTTALQFNQTGGGNTAVGQNALNQNTATGNTAVGQGALAANTTGGPNNAFGFQALTANTTGNYNSAFGDSALASNTTGIRNNAFGRYALNLNTTGNENVAVGNFAGTTFNAALSNVTGSDNVFIGFSAGPGTPTQLNNAVAIGANAVVSASNTMVLGTPGMSVVVGASTAATTFQVVGDIRVGTSGTNGCIQGFGGTPIAGTCSSDERLKQNIEPFASVLDKVTQLQPVTYDWRAEEHPEYHFGSERTSGLIAQEVEKVFPNMVAVDERGYKAVNYSQLPLLLLEAVRELKAEKDATAQRQSDQIQAQQLQIQQLLSQVEAFKARLEDMDKK